MTLKNRIVIVLLRLYPVAWRREYGPELADLVMADSLTFRVVADVACHGLWQRVRTAEPSTLLGLAAMLTVLTGFAWNIVAPPATGKGLAALLRESSKTLPTVTVAPFTSELYV